MANKKQFEFYYASYGVGTISKWSIDTTRDPTTGAIPNPAPLCYRLVGSIATGIAQHKSGEDVYITGVSADGSKHFVRRMDESLSSQNTREIVSNDYGWLSHIIVHAGHVFVSTAKGMLRLDLDLQNPKLIGPPSLIPASFAQYKGELYCTGQLSSETENSVWKVALQDVTRHKSVAGFAMHSLAFDHTGIAYLSGYERTLRVLRTFESDFSNELGAARAIDQQDLAAPVLSFDGDGNLYGADMWPTVTGTVSYFCQLDLSDKLKIGLKSILKNGDSPLVSGHSQVCFVRETSF